MAESAVVLIPKCAECDQMWLPWDSDRWQAYWVSDCDDNAFANDALLFYCPSCAEREFGERH